MAYYTHHEPLDMTWADALDAKKRLEGAQDFFEGVLQQLYGKEPIDLEKLNDWLDEMANYLNVKMPKGDLTIKREENYD